MTILNWSSKIVFFSILCLFLGCFHKSAHQKHIIDAYENNILEQIDNNQDAELVELFSIMSRPHQIGIKSNFNHSYAKALANFKNLNLVEARSILSKLIGEHAKSNPILLYEAKLLLNKVNLFDETNLNQVRDELTKNIQLMRPKQDPLSQYYYLRFMHQYSEYLSTTNRIFHSLAASQLCLSYIKEKKLNYRRLLASCHQTIGNTCAKESNVYSKTAIRHFEDQITLHKQLDLNDTYVIKSKIGLLLIENGRSIDSSEYFTIDNQNMELYAKYLIQFNWLILKGSLTQNLNFQHSILSSLDPAKNQWLYGYILSDIANLYLEQDDPKRFEKALQDLLSFNHKINSKLLKYKIANLIRRSYFKSKAKTHQVIESLLHERKEALTLTFDYNEFHLSDVFSENCGELLDYLSKEKIRTNDTTLIKNIVEIYNDSHQRAIKNSIHNQGISESIELKEKKLNLIDDFQKDTVSIALYQSLFDLYELELARFKKKYLTKSKTEISYLQIHQLFEDNHHIYLFFFYNDNYYSIYLSSKYMEVKKILQNADLSTAIAKQNIKSLIRNKAKVLISPDYKLTMFPFENLLDKSDTTKIFYTSDLLSYIKYKPTFIHKENISLMSYSSPESLSSREVKQFPELAESYSEVKFIEKLLEQKADITCGYDLNIETVKNKFNLNQAVHIASHSFSSPHSRRNNFIIFRDAKASYYFKNTDILGLSNVPKLVVLNSCDGNVGKYISGEGNFSLVSSFFEKGCETVIHTTEKINDTDAKEIISLMYQNWNRHSNIYDALYFAKRSFGLKNPKKHDVLGRIILSGNPNLYLL